jgi:hypothetical protein
MLGGFITNIKLPPSSFRFFLAPMYAIGSKKFTGIGFIDYSFYPAGIFRKIKIGLNGSTFTMNEFIDDKENKTSLSFRKIVPELKLVLNEKDPRANKMRFIQFKSFIIYEEGLRFFRDTVITPGTPPDTSVETRHRTISENRTLNQLRLVIENHRALYPYRGELKLEQGQDFMKAAFTGNYFFNYPKGGGLQVRLFGGKFFYTSAKTVNKQFATERYHLNMTGPNGYEDHTYSDYFIGRNRFEGAWSQQIMQSEGAFKVRTDLLAAKVGKTDDWLMALNFSTTIPAAINPLALLPIKIPVKLFLDIGSHAQAWETNAEEDRFLYDAGLHIPLLRETVNIYIPLVYSSIYKEYFLSSLSKKERFWKKISFSIDISNFSLRKIDNRLDL